MKPPRVAYLLKKFPRLSETFILNELLGQQALGTPLHVFSRRPTDDEPRHPAFVELRAPIEVLPHPREIDPWSELFLRNEEGLLRAVEAAVRRFSGLGHARLPSLLAEAVVLKRRCAELGVDHLHTHFATDSAVTAMLLSALGGPGYSVTLHAKDIYRETVSPDILSAVIEGSRFSITVCDANVRHLRQLVSESAAARLRRLFNGIDLDAFRFAKDARDPAHVLSVGRLVEKKGFDVLLHAVAQLAEQGRDVQLTIVGDGEEQDRLASLIDRLALGRRVRLAGALEASAVADLMARATVFCLPCVVGQDGNRDALPTVLVEALACGLPVVSTPVTGIPEILDGGRAGLLVPERDVGATAAAIASLLDDPARRRDLARAGRVRAESCFDRRRIAIELNDGFAAAVKEGRSACASPV